MVACASGGIATIVRGGVTGLLVPPGDPAALAKAMGALLDAPERRREMGQAARAHAEARHGLNQAADSLDDILRAAISR